MMGASAMDQPLIPSISGQAAESIRSTAGLGKLLPESGPSAMSLIM